MTILNAIILGLVQGVTEFLPVSSSGHLAILQTLFGMSDVENGHMFFDVLLHLGTLTAICFVYWNDIAAMFNEVSAIFKGRTALTTKDGKAVQFPAARLLVMILIATLPLVLVLPVNDYIEELGNYSFFVGIALILTGFVLYAADKLQVGKKTQKNLTVKDAIIIGLCQCVAVIPGISRSGVTITAGLARGANRNFAVKFSLLMSIPTVLGATLIELIKAFSAGIDVSLIPAYIIGMVVSMVSGVLAISAVKYVVNKGKFGGFSYYCWVVGALSIVLTMIF